MILPSLCQAKMRMMTMMKSLLAQVDGNIATVWLFLSQTLLQFLLVISLCLGLGLGLFVIFFSILGPVCLYQR